MKVLFKKKQNPVLFFVPSGTVTMLATFLRPNKPCVLALVWLCHLIDPVRMNLGDVETEVYKIGGGRLPPPQKKITDTKLGM